MTLIMHTSQMYHNQRHTRVRVSDDAVMRDAKTETCDLCVSILRAGVSVLCVSHIVHKLLKWSSEFMIYLYCPKHDRIPCRGKNISEIY
jgi:hypothetical protein